MKDNLVKTTCKELGVTQKKLAEIMGTSDSTVRHWKASEEIPNMATNFMNLLLKNKKLEEQSLKVKNFLFLIDELKGVQKMNIL